MITLPATILLLLLFIIIIIVPLLALGGDDTKLHFYVEADGGKFVRSLSLTGHEDWIRAVQITADGKRERES